jgi:hypothetical protein
MYESFFGLSPPVPALPPITAVYLSDDIYYQGGVLRQPKFGAFQWPRRHLNVQRDG